MACSDTGDNLELIAAALNALTNKNIVSKSEYLIIQQKADSGIDTGYILKGEVNVPQTIEQTYAYNYESFTPTTDTIDEIPVQKRSRWMQFAKLLVVGTAIGGVGIVTGGAGIAIGAAGAAIGAAGLAIATSTIGSIAVVGGTAAAVGGTAVAVGGTVVAVVGTGAAVGGAGVATVGAAGLLSNSAKKPPPTVVEDKIPLISNKSVQICTSSSNDQCLSYQGTKLQDTNTLQAYHITNNSTVTSSVRAHGGSQELHYLDSTYMDPSWDHDFTNESDGDKKSIRGGYPYYRPYGWKRIGIQATRKYRDATWLGHTNSNGEWAVTYHGTKQAVFHKICEEGYKVGPRHLYGEGVYSSPYICEAKAYATEFKYKGVRYLGVFQNRVNPKGAKIEKDGRYWVCPNPADIRPYGLCMKAC